MISLELSNYAGLIATVVLTFNFLLGMLLATAYKRSIYWKNYLPGFSSLI